MELKDRLSINVWPKGHPKATSMDKNTDIKNDKQLIKAVLVDTWELHL